MLRIEALTVRYPKQSTPVLRDVSLDIGAGERVAIVGPSGSGKTTLFRAVSGFVPIEHGRIEVGGVDVGSARGRHLRELRCRIGVIAQQHDLVDRVRVYQNVMAGALGRWSTLRALRFLFWPRRAELDEASAALRRVGTPEKLRNRTSELSGGQQQRVAIARALVQHPLVLLADEPIASLDPELSRHILALLCDLAGDAGMALLCALHQRELATEYFDRVVELRAGALSPPAGGRAAPAARTELSATAP